MHIIGLTGGIASGKSSAAKIFSELGIPVIDADQLARDAVLPGMPSLASIVSLLGKETLREDGALDREAVATRVFADPSLRQRLENILHPAIKALAEKRLTDLKKEGCSVAVYMAPLLIEAGVADRVDEIWVVYADRETQLVRAMNRDGLSREEVERRLAAQIPMDEKRNLGRIVIDNRGTEEDLRNKVLELCRKELGIG